MNILVTGAAGFIGSNFVHLYMSKFPDHKIVVIDSMTYAGDMPNLSGIEDKVSFYKGCIGDQNLVDKILAEHKINHVYNFAAESHVDNSISNPGVFLETNIMATFRLLQSCRKYYESLQDKSKFRFLHVSTDEVYGSLAFEDAEIFSEKTTYKPNSPYSASKAASDHLVRSFIHTYNLPCLTTNCSNNYGKRQNIEKLIPKTIMACINKDTIPVYGNGLQIRDWIWVDDHCNGLILAMQNGNIGETYCFGGDCETKNIDIINKICEIMNRVLPADIDYASLITFVQDRAGHDLRYAISSEKAKQELGFKHSGTLLENLEETIRFYMDKNSLNK